MFSTHLPKVNNIPREYLYVGIGLVAFIGLLIALAAVAAGEVKKAQLRGSLLASQHTAAAYCVETTRGAALNQCMRQARAEPYAEATTLIADNKAARNDAMGSGVVQGLMPVSFNARR